MVQRCKNCGYQFYGEQAPRQRSVDPSALVELPVLPDARRWSSSHGETAVGAALGGLRVKITI